MDKAVVVISFDDPDKIGEITEKVKFVFEDDASLVVYAAINEVSQEILSFLNGLARGRHAPAIPKSKEHILVEAENIIHGQRRDDYGSAEDSFKRIWDLWVPILNTDILTGPEKVALCMMQLKVARYMKSRDRDSVVDIAGYAGCLAQVKGWEDA